MAAAMVILVLVTVTVIDGSSVVVLDADSQIADSNAHACTMYMTITQFPIPSFPSSVF